MRVKTSRIAPIVIIITISISVTLVAITISITITITGLPRSCGDEGVG
jgi:hypothetical protein